MRLRNCETAYRQTADGKRADREGADGIGANSDCGDFQFFLDLAI